jgi:biotin-(acetyl-CoA carboxylase) ligase
VATGVDADGALLVRTPEGALRRVLAGDVTLREDAL